MVKELLVRLYANRMSHLARSTVRTNSLTIVSKLTSYIVVVVLSPF